MNYKEVVEALAAQGIIVGDETVGYKVNPYLELPKSLGFQDVAIMQGKNICSSRGDANLSSLFARDRSLEIPLIAANMSSVTSADFCNKLSELGALGVLHRAWADDESYIEEAAKLEPKGHGWVAASVGVGLDQVKLATKLAGAGVNIIVIDIAQGYSQAVIDTGRLIRKELPDVGIIVGNTVNPAFMYEVDDFASAVKVGIAQGSVCETKNTAGCTVKQWSAVDSFKEVSRKLGLPIISDGSIKEPADFTKAIAAGANSVMAGSIFARCPESAAEAVLNTSTGLTNKRYFGMASREAQERWRGGLKSGTCPEGKSVMLPLGESVSKLVERYSGALKSGITYAGANDIQSFQDIAKFVRL